MNSNKVEIADGRFLQYIETLKISDTDYYKHKVEIVRDDLNSSYNVYLDELVDYDTMDKDKFITELSNKINQDPSEEDIFLSASSFNSNPVGSGGYDAGSIRKIPADYNVTNIESFDRALDIIQNIDCDLEEITKELEKYDYSGIPKTYSTTSDNVQDAVSQLNRIRCGSGASGYAGVVQTYKKEYAIIFNSVLDALYTSRFENLLDRDQLSISDLAGEAGFSNEDYLNEIRGMIDKANNGGYTRLADFQNALNAITSKYTVMSKDDYTRILESGALSIDDLDELLTEDELKNMTDEQKEEYISNLQTQKENLFEYFNKNMGMSRDDFEQYYLEDNVDELASLLAGQSFEAAKQTATGKDTSDNINELWNNFANTYYGTASGQEYLLNSFLENSDTQYDEYNAIGYTNYIKYCMSMNHENDWLKEEFRQVAAIIGKINSVDSFSKVVTLDRNNSADLEAIKAIELQMEQNGGACPYNVKKVGDTYRVVEYTKLGDEMLYYMDYHWGENNGNYGDNKVVTAFSNQGYVDAVERNFKGLFIATNGTLNANYYNDDNKQTEEQRAQAERDYYILSGVIKDDDRKEELAKEGKMAFNQLTEYIGKAGHDVSNLLDSNYIDQNKERIMEETGLEESQLYNFSVNYDAFGDLANIDPNAVGGAIAMSSALMGAIQLAGGVAKFAENVGDAVTTAVYSDIMLNGIAQDPTGEYYYNPLYGIADTIELSNEFNEFKEGCWNDFIKTELYKSEHDEYMNSLASEQEVRTFMDKYSFDANTGLYLGKYYTYEDIPQNLKNRYKEDFFKAIKMKEWSLSGSSSSNYYLASFKDGIRNGGDFERFDSIDQDIVSNAKEQLKASASIKVDNVGNWMQENLYEKGWYKNLEDVSFVKHDNILGLAANQIGNMAVPVALSMVPGVGQGLSKAAIVLNSIGAGAEEAFASGAEYNQAIGYAVLSAATELLIEGLFSGVAGYGEGWRDDLIDGFMDNALPLPNSRGATIAKKLIAGGLGEATEEIVTDFVTPLWQSLTYLNDQSYFDLVSENVSLESELQTFWVSFLSSMVFGSVEVVQKNNAYNNVINNLDTSIKEIPGFKESLNDIYDDFMRGDTFENTGFTQTEVMTQILQNNLNKLSSNPETMSAVKNLNEKLITSLAEYQSTMVSIPTKDGNIEVSKSLISNIADLYGLNKSYSISDGELRFENSKDMNKFIEIVSNISQDNLSNQISYNKEIISILQANKGKFSETALGIAISEIMSENTSRGLIDIFSPVAIEVDGTTINVPITVVMSVTSKFNIGENNIVEFLDGTTTETFVEALYDKAIEIVNNSNSNLSSKLASVTDLSLETSQEILKDAFETAKNVVISGNIPSVISNIENVVDQNLIKVEMSYVIDGEVMKTNLYIDGKTKLFETADSGLPGIVEKLFFNDDKASNKVASELQQIVGKNIGRENVYVGEIVYDSVTDTVSINEVENSKNYVDSLNKEAVAKEVEKIGTVEEKDTGKNATNPVAEEQNVDNKDAVTQTENTNVDNKDVVTQAENTNVDNKDVVTQTENTNVDNKDVVTQTENTNVDNKDVVTQTENTNVDNKDVVTQAESANVDNKDVVTQTENTNVDNKDVVTQTENTNVDNKDTITQAESTNVDNKDVVTQTESTNVDNKDVVTQTENTNVDNKDVVTQAESTNTDAASTATVTTAGAAGVVAANSAVYPSQYSNTTNNANNTRSSNANVSNETQTDGNVSRTTNVSQATRNSNVVVIDGKSIEISTLKELLNDNVLKRALSTGEYVGVRVEKALIELSKLDGVMLNSNLSNIVDIAKTLNEGQVIFNIEDVYNGNASATVLDLDFVNGLTIAERNLLASVSTPQGLVEYLQNNSLSNDLFTSSELLNTGNKYVDMLVKLSNKHTNMQVYNALDVVNNNANPVVIDSSYKGNTLVISTSEVLDFMKTGKIDSNYSFADYIEATKSLMSDLSNQGARINISKTVFEGITLYGNVSTYLNGNADISQLDSTNIINDCSKLYNYLINNNYSLNDSVMERLSFINDLDSSKTIANLSNYLNGGNAIVIDKNLDMMGVNIDTNVLIDLVEMKSDAYISFLRDGKLSSIPNADRFVISNALEYLMESNPALKEYYSTQYAQYMDMLNNGYVLSNSNVVVPFKFGSVNTFFLESLLNEPFRIIELNSKGTAITMESLNEFIQYLDQNGLSSHYSKTNLDLLNKMMSIEMNFGKYDARFIDGILKDPKSILKYDKLTSMEIRDVVNEYVKALNDNGLGTYYSQSSVDFINNPFANSKIPIPHSINGISGEVVLSYLTNIDLLNDLINGKVSVDNKGSLVSAIKTLSTMQDLIGIELDAGTITKIDELYRSNLYEIATEALSPVITESFNKFGEALVSSQGNVMDAISQLEALNYTKEQIADTVLTHAAVYSYNYDKSRRLYDSAYDYLVNNGMSKKEAASYVADTYDAMLTTNGSDLLITEPGIEIYVQRGICWDNQPYNLNYVVDEMKALKSLYKSDIPTTVRIFDTFNPYDKYWSIQYNSENFCSSATGGYGIINLYRNPGIHFSVLSHEYAHGIDLAIQRDNNLQTRFSETQEYMDAVRKDKDFPTEYSKKAYSEDFAESIAHMRNDPQSFSKKFPNRYKVLSKYINLETSTVTVNETVVNNVNVENGSSIGVTVKNDSGVIEIEPGHYIGRETVRALMSQNVLEEAMRTGEYAGLRIERALTELSKLDGVTLDPRLENLVNAAKTLNEGQVIFNIEDVYNGNASATVLDLDFVNGLTIAERNLLASVSTPQGLVEYLQNNSLSNDLFTSSELLNTGNKYVDMLVKLSNKHTNMQVYNALDVVNNNANPIVIDPSYKGDTQISQTMEQLKETGKTVEVANTNDSMINSDEYYASNGYEMPTMISESSNNTGSNIGITKNSTKVEENNSDGNSGFHTLESDRTKNYFENNKSDVSESSSISENVTTENTNISENNVPSIHQTFDIVEDGVVKQTIDLDECIKDKNKLIQTLESMNREQNTQFRSAFVEYMDNVTKSKLDIAIDDDIIRYYDISKFAIETNAIMLNDSNILKGNMFTDFVRMDVYNKAKEVFAESLISLSKFEEYVERGSLEIKIMEDIINNASMDVRNNSNYKMMKDAISKLNASDTTDGFIANLHDVIYNNADVLVIPNSLRGSNIKQVYDLITGKVKNDKLSSTSLNEVGYSANVLYEYLLNNGITLDSQVMEKLKFIYEHNGDTIILNISEYLNGEKAILGKRLIKIYDTYISTLDVVDLLRFEQYDVTYLLKADTQYVEDMFDAMQELLYSNDAIRERYSSNFEAIKNLYKVYKENIAATYALNNPNIINGLSGKELENRRREVNKFLEFLQENNVDAKQIFPDLDRSLEFINKDVAISDNIGIETDFSKELREQRENGASYGAMQGKVNRLLKRSKMNVAIEKLFGKKIYTEEFTSILEQMEFTEEELNNALLKANKRLFFSSNLAAPNYIDSLAMIVMNNYPGMSKKDAVLFLYLMETEEGALNGEVMGICNYAAVANMLLQKYFVDPVEFETKLGYPLYEVINGVKKFNSTRLLVDMYSTINEGVLINKVDGRYVIAKNNSTYLNLSPHGFIAEDYLNKFLEKKGLKVDYAETFRYDSSRELVHYNKLITEIREALARGDHVHVSAWDFGLYNTKNKLIGDRFGAHIMSVLEITNDGKLVVDSWGERLIFDLKEEMAMLDSENKKMIRIVSYGLSNNKTNAHSINNRPISINTSSETSINVEPTGVTGTSMGATEVIIDGASIEVDTLKQLQDANVLKTALETGNYQGIEIGKALVELSKLEGVTLDERTQKVVNAYKRLKDGHVLLNDLESIYNGMPCVIVPQEVYNVLTNEEIELLKNDSDFIVSINNKPKKVIDLISEYDHNYFESKLEELSDTLKSIEQDAKEFFKNKTDKEIKEGYDDFRKMCYEKLARESDSILLKDVRLKKSILSKYSTYIVGDGNNIQASRKNLIGDKLKNKDANRYNKSISATIKSLDYVERVLNQYLENECRKAILGQKYDYYINKYSRWFTNKKTAYNFGIMLENIYGKEDASYMLHEILFKVIEDNKKTIATIKLDENGDRSLLITASQNSLVGNIDEISNLLIELDKIYKVPFEELSIQTKQNPFDYYTDANLNTRRVSHIDSSFDFTRRTSYIWDNNYTSQDIVPEYKETLVKKLGTDEKEAIEKWKDEAKKGNTYIKNNQFLSMIDEIADADIDEYRKGQVAKVTLPNYDIVYKWAEGVARELVVSNSDLVERWNSAIKADGSFVSIRSRNDTMVDMAETIANTVLDENFRTNDIFSNRLRVLFGVPNKTPALIDKGIVEGSGIPSIQYDTNETVLSVSSNDKIELNKIDNNAVSTQTDKNMTYEKKHLLFEGLFEIKDGKSSIYGAHRLNEFEKLVRENNISIVKITAHPTIKGVYNIEYKYVDDNGIEYPGDNPKTVYDSKVISDARILKLREEALSHAKIVKTELKTEHDIEIAHTTRIGIASNGLLFQSYYDDNQLQSGFPCIDVDNSLIREFMSEFIIPVTIDGEVQYYSVSVNPNTDPNVITTRGPELIEMVSSIIKANGYVSHDSTINLGTLTYNESTGKIDSTLFNVSDYTFNLVLKGETVNLELSDIVSDSEILLDWDEMMSTDESTRYKDAIVRYIDYVTQNDLDVAIDDNVMKFYDAYKNAKDTNMYIVNERNVLMYGDEAILSPVDRLNTPLEPTSVNTITESDLDFIDVSDTGISEDNTLQDENVLMQNNKDNADLSKLNITSQIETEVQRPSNATYNLKGDEIVLSSNGANPKVISQEVYDEFMNSYEIRAMGVLDINNAYDFILNTNSIYQLLELNAEHTKSILEKLVAIANSKGYENRVIKEASYLLDLMKGDYTTSELYDLFSVAHVEFNAPHAFDDFVKVYEDAKSIDLAIKMLEDLGYSQYDIADSLLHTAVVGERSLSSELYYKAFDYLVEKGISEKNSAMYISNKYNSMIERRGTRTIGTTSSGVLIKVVNNIKTNNKLLTIQNIDKYIKQAEKYLSKTDLKEIIIYDTFAPHNIASEKIYYKGYVEKHGKRFTAAASASNTSIYLWEDFDDLSSLIHEYAHTIDWYVGKSFGFKTAFSNTSEWIDAVNKDDLITRKRVSGYAYESLAEDFAEFIKYFNKNPIDVAIKYPNRYKVLSNYLDMSVDNGTILSYLDSEVLIDKVNEISSLLTNEGTMLEFIKQYIDGMIDCDNSFTEVVISELDSIYESIADIVEDYGVYSLFKDIAISEGISSKEFMDIIKDYLDGKDISSKFSDMRNLDLIKLVEKDYIEEWYQEEAYDITLETEKVVDEGSNQNPSSDTDSDSILDIPTSTKRVSTVSLNSIPHMFSGMDTSSIIGILEGKISLNYDDNFMNTKRSIMSFIKYLSDNNIRLNLNERANQVIENLRGTNLNLNILNFMEVLNNGTPIYAPLFVNVDGMKISTDFVMLFLENNNNEMSLIFNSDTYKTDASQLLKAINKLGNKDIIYSKYRKTIRLAERISNSYIYRNYGNSYMLPQEFNGFYTEEILNADLLFLTRTINSLDKADRKAYREAIIELSRYVHKSNIKLPRQDISRLDSLYKTLTMEDFKTTTIVKGKLYDLFERSYRNGGEFGSNQGKVREIIEEFSITDIIKGMLRKDVDKSAFLEELSKHDIDENTFLRALYKKEKVGIIEGIFETGDINLKLFKSLIEQVKMNYPNMSTMDAVRFLYLVESRESNGPGICSNPLLVNMIFDKFVGKEELFEKTFGYPMYVKSNTNRKVLNDARLLVDLYSTLNDGTLVTRENGKYVISTTNKDYLRTYNLSGLKMDAVEKFLNKKGIDMKLERTLFFYSNEGIPTYDSLMQQIKTELEKGNYVVLGGNGFDIDAENFDYIENCDAHGVTVVGIDTSGELIVDSWGMKSRIDLRKELSRIGLKFNDRKNTELVRKFTISSYSIE